MKRKRGFLDFWFPLIFVFFLIIEMIATYNKWFSIETILVIIILTIVLFGGIGLTMAIIKIVQNERRFKKFRNELKIGDSTDQGTVLDVTNGIVKIAKFQELSNVYPPDDV